MTGRLAGQIVLITGATKGIGRAAAVAAAREGAHVTVTGRDADGAAETLRQVEAVGARALFLPHDVRREDEWETVIAETERQFGPLTGLVNNAGVFLLKPLAETSEADFDIAYEVNVEGQFLGIKHALRAFARSKTAGRIVNVSSLMGQVGVEYGIAYCGTKGAITGMTKAAALEGAAMIPKVRVNSLHPGVIWTPMIQNAFKGHMEMVDAYIAGTPLRMIGQPEHMADAILFLLSDDSAYMTGAELTADGGRGAD